MLTKLKALFSHKKETQPHECAVVVLTYTEKMNIWETKRFYRSRVEVGYEFTAEKDLELAGSQTIEELNLEFQRIFNQFCTQKERKYSGEPTSWTKGGQYHGVTKDTVIDVNDINSNKVEVIVQGDALPGQKFKFVLIKQKEQWLIDHLFDAIGDDNWSRAYL